MARFRTDYHLITGINFCMMARQPNARRRAGYMVAYGGAMRCQRPKAIDPKN